MISYTPQTPRRRWPGVLLLVVILVVFLFLISACGDPNSTHATTTPKVAVPTDLHEPPNITRIDMGQDTGDVKVACWNGFRVFVTASGKPGYSINSAVSLFAVLDSRCDDPHG